MKSFLLSVFIISLFSISNLYSQDIKAKLKGHLAEDGFTVVDDNGKVLFRVTGEGSVGINTDTPTGFLDVQGGEAIDDQVPRSINLIAKSFWDNLGGDVLLQSGGSGAGRIKIFGGTPEQGGDIDILSGSGNVQSGNINIMTGGSNNSGGDINLVTNFSYGGGAIRLNTHGEQNNYIELLTDDVMFGGNNYIKLNTGFDAQGTNSIELKTGDAVTSGNDIILSTGNNVDIGKGGDIVFNLGTGTPDGKVIVNGSGTYSGTWTQASDERYKKNITPIQNAVDKIQQLNGVSYELKSDEFPEKNFADGRQIGLIAQEVEKVFPELVKTDAEGYKSVAYQNMVAVLLEAVKEQQKSIDELKKEVEKLKSNQVIEVTSNTKSNN